MRLKSSLVYKFSCAQCASEYVGMTARTLGTRDDKHVGVSYRTGALLTEPPHSAIRDHDHITIAVLLVHGCVWQTKALLFVRL